MKTLLTFLSLCFVQTLYAQQYQVEGTVYSTDKVSVAGASISLLNSKDSTWVTTATTNTEGIFTLKAYAGQYILKVTAIGYSAISKRVNVVSDVSGLVFHLDRKNKELQEVVVKERTESIRMELGKTVVDVGKTAKEGIDALELLRKLPGVTVSPSGDISVDGKQGVMLLVDGKRVYMQGQELTAYLRGVMANQVKEVELMTQPSAKYDAEGNVGIINFKMNKNRLKKWKNTSTARYSQGVYGFSSVNTALHYNKGDWHPYIMPAYWGGSSFLEKVELRSAVDKPSGNTLSSVHEDIYMRETFHDYNLKIGVDYDLSERTTVGLFVKGVYHPNDETDKTNSIITDHQNYSELKNVSVNDNGFLRQHMLSNIYANHEFKNKSKLTCNADYYGTWKNMYQRLDSRNYNQQGNLVSTPYLLKSNIPVSSNLYSVKADYEGEVKGQKLEVGVKCSYVTIDEQNLFDQYNGQVWQFDTGRSTHFRYRENINALYVNTSVEKGRWQAQLGVRGELTFINGHELFQDKRFSRERLSLFPTLFVSHQVDSNHTIECNYGRRIKRPFYRELNPFTRFVSQYTYASGNPNLLPQFSNNIELKHGYKSKLFTTLSYASVTNAFTDYFEYDSQTNISNYSTTNQANLKTATLSMYMKLPVIKEWLLTCTGSGYYTSYRGVVGQEMQAQDNWGYSFSLDSQFYFKDGWYASARASYTGPNITLFGQTDSLLYTSASVSKKLWNDSAMLRLDISDPFGWYVLNTETSIQQAHSISNTVFNTRNAALSFSYNIGKGDAKTRKVSNTDEMQRM